MSSDTYSVTVDVGSRTVPLEDLVQKYERGEMLHAEEINILAEYPGTGVDVAEYRRLRAKMLFGSNPHADSCAAAEEAATEWLREIFEEHGVVTVGEHHDLLKELDDSHDVHEALEKLTENVTPFERQGESSLMDRLDQREEEPVEELYKPEDAGDDWDPVTDQGLHEFIALMEDASEDKNTLGEMGSWDELKEAAEFDPEEWGLEAERTDGRGS